MPIFAKLCNLILSPGNVQTEPPAQRPATARPRRCKPRPAASPTGTSTARRSASPGRCWCGGCRGGPPSPSGCPGAWALGPLCHSPANHCWDRRCHAKRHPWGTVKPRASDCRTLNPFQLCRKKGQLTAYCLLGVWPERDRRACGHRGAPSPRLAGVHGGCGAGRRALRVDERGAGWRGPGARPAGRVQRGGPPGLRPAAGHPHGGSGPAGPAHPGHRATWALVWDVGSRLNF